MPGVTSIGVAALIVVLLAAAGVGYASSSGALGWNNHDEDHGPRFHLVWALPDSTTGSVPYVRCSTSFVTSSLVLSAANLAPGTSCALSATIKNGGALAAILDSRIFLATPTECPFFTYSDNLHGLSQDPVLSAGQTFAYTAVLGLGAAAGNPCQGTTAVVYVAITGGSCWSTLAEADCH